MIYYLCIISNFYSHGGTNISHTIYGPGSGPIWLDGFLCLGTELILEDCQLSTTSWNNSNCNHTEDAAVVCIDLQNTGEEIVSCDLDLLLK